MNVRWALMAIIAMHLSTCIWCQSSVPQHVYKPGKDVTAPELQAPDFAEMISDRCLESRAAKVVFALYSDEQGKPRRVLFKTFMGDDYDRLAAYVVAADHFKPGMRDGIPVWTKVNLEVKFRGCVVNAEDGSAQQHLRLKGQPEQVMLPFDEPPPPQGMGMRTNNGVTAPYPVHTEPVAPTERIAKRHDSGTCLVTFTVDESGLPQNAKIATPVDPEFDRKALESVMRYRFYPAMKGDSPKAVVITIGVRVEVH